MKEARGCDEAALKMKKRLYDKITARLRDRNNFCLLKILVTVLQIALQFPNVIVYRSDCYPENYQYPKNKTKQ